MPGKSMTAAPPPNDNLYAAFAGCFPADRTTPLLRGPGDAIASFWTAAERSSAVAGWLRQAGVRPGDRVTIQAPKSANWLWLYLGCLRAGAIVHPLNDDYQRDELRYFISNAEPKLIVCAPGRQPLFAEIATAGTRIETMDDSGGSAPLAWVPADPDDACVPRRADDVAVLLYSSGTTGRPKGALITHGNLVSNARTLVATWRFVAEDRLLHALPVYHAHGLFVGFGCTLMSGASMLLLPRFDVDAVLAALPEATVMMGVPTHYSRLLGSPALTAESCRTIRLFISGSAPLRPEIFAAFEARTGHRILERYGMTETGMNSSNPLAGARRPGTVGKPLPGIDIRITNPDEARAPVGSVGEIEVRGPNVFAGYWRSPAETRAAFTADGWFRTGDQGVFSADGYLSIVGRSKDLVITGGLNVYPREVEQVLDRIPGLAESAVIGVPHPDFGEAVVAIVVATASAKAPTADDVIAAARASLAAYKAPKRVFFVAALPRNTMGKVQKTALREQYASTFIATAATTRRDLGAAR